MFALTKTEAKNLKSQFATSRWGGTRKAPLAFTEHGVAMLSAILNSERAVKMSILVIRAFVRLREMLSTHKDFALRLGQLENTQSKHGSVIQLLAIEIEQLKIPLRTPPALPPKRRIGFPTA